MAIKTDMDIAVRTTFFMTFKVSGTTDCLGFKKWALALAVDAMRSSPLTLGCFAVFFCAACNIYLPSSS
ncbi:hypothetical protein V6N13_055482 [Hibiscus sabdariffa]|uniref:Uncharacterized protein n=1 Tax=Hibiscus sabdariffa TaxID=183260 RepID=A0ABR2BM45_9ROSI